MRQVFTSLFIALLLISCTKENKVEPISTIGDDERKIEVYDLEGLDYLLNIEDENIHVVNFWATWCAPCIKELPDFEKLNYNFKDDGLKITLVSIDDDRTYDNLVSFTKDNLISDVKVIEYPNDNDLAEVINKNWDGSLPATMIFDKNKRIFINGVTSYESLIDELDRFGWKIPEQTS